MRDSKGSSPLRKQNGSPQVPLPQDHTREQTNGGAVQGNPDQATVALITNPNTPHQPGNDPLLLRKLTLLGTGRADDSLLWQLSHEDPVLVYGILFIYGLEMKVVSI